MKEEELVKYQLEQHQRNQEIDKATRYMSIPEKSGFIAGVDWTDQHPRKGLWDAEKVVEWILNNYETYEQIYLDTLGNYSDFQIDQFIRNLQKAMEE